MAVFVEVRWSLRNTPSKTRTSNRTRPMSCESSASDDAKSNTESHKSQRPETLNVLVQESDINAQLFIQCADGLCIEHFPQGI